MTTLGDSSSATADAHPQALAADVARSLTLEPKRLPSKYLYDALGSQLFEAICELPWYKITRGERALLDQQAETIASRVRDPATLIELGGGNGEKISMLLAAFERAQRATRVHLVDISSTALELSARTLAHHESVTFIPHQVSYEVGLHEALARETAGGAAIVLFLGSNIGNLGPDAAHRFLGDIRHGVQPGDFLLLGADLVKPEAELLLAYDDPLGVTTAFNKNLLARLNRELDADFDLTRFEHLALWNAGASRIESYLVSRAEQTVCLEGAGICVRLEDGERIWTESSYKYEPAGIIEMGARVGFVSQAQWVEPESRFALTLFGAE